MKVVHITEALAGGVHTYFRNLSYFFGETGNKEGIETVIIYSSHREQVDQKKVRDTFSKNVTLIDVPMTNELSPLKDLRSAIELYKILKKIDPDVVHLHSSKAGVLGRAANFFRFKKTKLYYTPHGYSFLQDNISPLKKRFFRLIEKYSQYFFGGVTIACGDTEYEIAKTLGKAKLIRNGIAIESLVGLNSFNNNSRLTIGTVGRISYQKNPALFNKIAARFPSFNFLWIGDGEMRELLTEGNITITGWFHEQDEVLKHLVTLDIYLQTSIWEGLPIAVLEAMALQKPVLATNVIGNKDIVRHGETGFLFKDAEELDPYLQELSSTETRTHFGNNGLKRCRELFSRDKNFTDLVSLYKED